MATNLVIKKRRETVFELVMTGETISNIAQHFNKSNRTIDKDLKYIKKYMAKRLEETDLKEFFIENKFKSNKRILKLWKIVVDKSISTKDKISALRELRKEDEHFIKSAQMLGIIPQTIINLTQNNINIEQRVTWNNISDMFKEIKDDEDGKRTIKG